MLDLRHSPVKEAVLSPRDDQGRHALARALSVGDVNQLGRNTRQAQRRRTVTPQSVAQHGEPVSLVIVEAQGAVSDEGAEGAVLFGQIGDSACVAFVAPRGEGDGAET